MVFVFGGLLSNLMTVLAVSESSFLYLLETVMAVCFLPRRARLLKQQRLERQKSATARRQMLETQQKERRKKGGHVECSQGEKTNKQTNTNLTNFQHSVSVLKGNLF